jgi:hypothetical protein
MYSKHILIHLRAEASSRLIYDQNPVGLSTTPIFKPRPPLISTPKASHLTSKSSSRPVVNSSALPLDSDSELSELSLDPIDTLTPKKKVSETKNGSKMRKGKEKTVDGKKSSVAENKKEAGGSGETRKTKTGSEPSGVARKSKVTAKKDGANGTDKGKSKGNKVTSRLNGKASVSVEKCKRQIVGITTAGIPKKPRPKKIELPVDPPEFEKVDTRLGLEEAEQRMAVRLMN